MRHQALGKTPISSKLPVMTEYPNTVPVYLDAMLRPNQSLSKPAFIVFMSGICVINLLSAIAFLSMGALPIAGFLGLDVLAVWLGFRFCFRDQRQWTRIRVTADCLRVDHVSPKGTASNVELPTVFTRVELKEPLTPNSWLTLAHKTEAYVIGRFLTVDERKSLADAIRDALSRARNERFASET